MCRRKLFSSVAVGNFVSCGRLRKASRCYGYRFKGSPARLFSGTGLGGMLLQNGALHPAGNPRHYSLLRAAIVVAVAMATANSRNAAL